MMALKITEDLQIPHFQFPVQPLGAMLRVIPCMAGTPHPDTYMRTARTCASAVALYGDPDGEMLFGSDGWITSRGKDVVIWLVGSGHRVLTFWLYLAVDRMLEAHGVRRERSTERLYANTFTHLFLAVTDAMNREDVAYTRHSHAIAEMTAEAPETPTVDRKSQADAEAALRRQYSADEIPAIMDEIVEFIKTNRRIPSRFASSSGSEEFRLGSFVYSAKVAVKRKTERGKLIQALAAPRNLSYAFLQSKNVRSPRAAVSDARRALKTAKSVVEFLDREQRRPRSINADRIVYYALRNCVIDKYARRYPEVAKLFAEAGYLYMLADPTVEFVGKKFDTEKVT